MAFIEGLFCTQNVHLGPGFLAVIERWPLTRGIPLYLDCISFYPLSLKQSPCKPGRNTAKGVMTSEDGIYIIIVAGGESSNLWSGIPYSSWKFLRPKNSANSANE